MIKVLNSQLILFKRIVTETSTTIYIRILRMKFESAFIVGDGLLILFERMVSATSAFVGPSILWIKSNGPIKVLNSPSEVAEHTIGVTPAGIRLCILGIKRNGGVVVGDCLRVIPHLMISIPSSTVSRRQIRLHLSRALHMCERLNKCGFRTICIRCETKTDAQIVPRRPAFLRQEFSLHEPEWGRISWGEY